MGEVYRFALTALAAYRLWKLVGDDAITQPARDAMLERGEAQVSVGFPNRWARAHELLSCPWCAGSWIAFALAFLTRKQARHPVLEALASAAVVGLVHRLVEEDA